MRERKGEMPRKEDLANATRVERARRKSKESLETTNNPSKEEDHKQTLTRRKEGYNTKEQARGWERQP